LILSQKKYITKKEGERRMTLSQKKLEELLHAQLNQLYENAIPRTLVNITVQLAFEEFRLALCRGDKIRIERLGILAPVIRKPRIGRNPKTGESIPVARRVDVKFKINNQLYDKMNEQYNAKDNSDNNNFKQL
jgi:integration host factor subunit beta